MPDNAAASEAARNLIRSRWNKIIDPAERRAQTEPARLASLAKRAEQQRARAEFATAFASYARPASHRRMTLLLGSGGKAAG